MAKTMSKEKQLYLRMRNLCGLLGVLLPWIALFSAGIVKEKPSEDWWWSISATYYQTDALVGILVPVCLLLISYIGYDTADNVITTLSGIMGLGIVMFPCSVSWLEEDALVGFFHIPMNISHVIHCICAAFFFLLMALNSILLFTKSGEVMTDRKKIRNRIYRICGYGMIVVEVAFLLSKILNGVGYLTMIYEIILLFLFGFAWLVKGEAFPCFNDIEETKIDVEKTDD